MSVYRKPDRCGSQIETMEDAGWVTTHTVVGVRTGTNDIWIIWSGLDATVLL